MSNFDSAWLANRIQEIVDTPRSPYSVIASAVDETASRAYVREVREHLTRQTGESDHVLKARSAIG